MALPSMLSGMKALLWIRWAWRSKPGSKKAKNWHVDESFLKEGQLMQQILIMMTANFAEN